VTHVYQLAVAAKKVPLSSCLLKGGSDELVDFSYSFWLVEHTDGLTLVDCGFHERQAARKSIAYERTPAEAVRLLGIDPGEISTLLLTHLHFDHAGALRDFPNATIAVQRADIDYFTGPLMRFPLCASGRDDDDMAALAEASADGRVTRLDGDTSFGPGIELSLVGGHTPGSQLVTISDGSQRIVLTGDAAHLYANIEYGAPFPVFHDVPSSCLAFERMQQLRDEGAVLVPGHDGSVRRDFDAVAGIPGHSVVQLL
jgi:glyoxylase-like metal-dependent hydrolase (beta-lactamase superfamily II)